MQQPEISIHPLIGRLPRFGLRSASVGPKQTSTGRLGPRHAHFKECESIPFFKCISHSVIHAVSAERFKMVELKVYR